MKKTKGSILLPVISMLLLLTALTTGLLLSRGTVKLFSKASSAPTKVYLSPPIGRLGQQTTLQLFISSPSTSKKIVFAKIKIKFDSKLMQVLGYNPNSRDPILDPNTPAIFLEESYFDNQIKTSSIKEANKDGEILITLAVKKRLDQPQSLIKVGTLLFSESENLAESVNAPTEMTINFDENDMQLVTGNKSPLVFSTIGSKLTYKLNLVDKPLGLIASATNTSGGRQSFTATWPKIKNTTLSYYDLTIRDPNGHWTKQLSTKISNSECSRTTCTIFHENLEGQSSGYIFTLRAVFTDGTVWRERKEEVVH